jgi:hypothetical protein
LRRRWRIESRADIELGAAHQLRSAHWGLAGTLGGDDADRLVAAGDDHRRVDDGARRADPFDDFGAKNLDPFHPSADRNFAVCAGRGREAVDAVAHRDGVDAPVDRRFTLVDFICVGGALGALWTKDETSGGELRQGFGDQLRAEFGEPGGKFACGLVRADRCADLAPTTSP